MRKNRGLAALLLIVPVVIFAVYSWAATGAIMTYPKFKAWTTAGTPLVGGLLYSYEPNSSTPKALYTTRSMTTEQTNPVVLDANGEASIWGAGAYKLVLKTSAGVQLWSLDYVNGIGGTDDNQTIFPELYGAVGDGSTDDTAAIEAAITACPTAGCRMKLTQTYRLVDDVSIPAKARLDFTTGGMFEVDDTYTMTIVSPGHIIATPTQQIFDGDGLVTFTYPGAVYPDWWQVNTTPGTTDMVPAINKAMVAGGDNSTIKFNGGIYLFETISECSDLPACAASGSPSYLENYFVNLLSNRTITCNGWGTILKVKDNLFDQSDDDESNAHMFQGFGVENVLIQNCAFDMNGYNNLPPSGKTRNVMAIRLDDGGKNVMIDNLYILNNPGHNNIVANNTSLATQATGLTVTNCVMEGGGSGLAGNTENTDFSFIYSEWAKTIVSNNRLVQPYTPYTWSGGIELHDNESIADSNLIVNCDPGVWVASANQIGALDLRNVVVSNNVMQDCARGVAFWSAGVIRDVLISGNTISLKWRGDDTDTTVSNDVYGVHMIWRGDTYPWTDAYAAGAPLHNISIENNVFSGEYDASEYDFFGGVGILATSFKGLNIRGNSFRNMPGNGVLILGSPYGLSNLVIQGNSFSNWGRSPYGYGKNAIQLDVSNSPAISWDTSEEIPDAGAFKLRHALITGNMFSKDDNSTDENGTVTSAYCVAVLADDNSSGHVEDVVIRDNMDWPCVVAETCTAAIGGNLATEENHVESGVIYSSLRDFVLGTESPNDRYPDGHNPGGMIGWNRHSLGSAAGVAAGRPIGYVNVTPGETPSYEPFGVIGAWKVGAYADRPDAVTTDVALPYICTDCTKCGKAGNANPELIWFVHDNGTVINKWFCDNATNGMIEAGIEE